MPVIWNPTGQLDVATDPGDLPMQIEGKAAQSGAMTRCTNLHLDRVGIASTRRGSQQVAAALAGSVKVTKIIEQGGTVFWFDGGKITQTGILRATGLTNAPWSAILYNPYNSTTQEIYSINGTDRKVIDNNRVREWGVDGPTATPKLNPNWCTQDWEKDYLTNTARYTQEAGNYQAIFDWEVDYIAGSPTGNDSVTIRFMWPFETAMASDLDVGSVYQVKYTYVRKLGSTVEFESNPSPSASYTTVADHPIRVAWEPCPDSQINYVRIYRTMADGSTFLYDSEYTDSAFPAFLIKADTSLGTECNWVNHNRPPLGTIVLGPAFDGTCFVIKDNLLYFCLPKQPEYWPENYNIEVSPIQHPVQAGAFLDSQLFVATKHDIYMIQGSGAASFFPLPMSAITGTVAPNCFEAIKGHGIIHLGNDGLYQYTGGKDQKISYAFDPIFLGETKGSMPGMNKTYIANCILKVYETKFYFGYPGGTSEYPDNFLVWDLKTDKVVHYQYSIGFTCFGINYQARQFLAADEDGNIWELEKYGYATDNGTAIAWDVQSAEFSHLRKYFPRYAKYDVKVGAGATAAGSILLDNLGKQTHNLNGDRNTKKRLVAGCTGDRLSFRLTGTGQVDIYGAEIE